MRIRRFVTLGVALAAAGALAACSSDSSGSGSVDLVGNYTLVSITQPPNPTLAPPNVSGSLSLTATEYGVFVSIDFPTPGAAIIADSGTYTLAGNAMTLNSSLGLGVTDGIWSFNSGTQNLTIKVVDVDTTSIVFHKN